MRIIGLQIAIALSLVAAIGCGGDSSNGISCGGTVETSCDVSNDNGLHTCYDYVAPDAASLQTAKSDCTSARANGTVLPACCDHSGAIARCVYTPTIGGTDTVWFLSGTVAAAQSACSSQNGAFAAL